MANEKQEGIEKQAEGLANSFVGILGLTEIVIGGLALYPIFLQLGVATTRTFPTTGYPVIDVALLACAASLVGRIIGLVIAIGMAVLNRLLRKTRWVTRLGAAITDYERRTKRPANTELQRIEYGAALITTDSPSRQAQLERTRTTAILSYAASIIAWPYANTLAPQFPGLACTIRWSAAALLLIGALQQLDYLNLITTLLIAGGKDDGNPGKG